MPPASEHAPALSDEIIQLLAWLARRGAYIDRSQRASAACIEVLRYRHGDIDVLGAVSRLPFENAIAAQLLLLRDDRFVLSATGRLALGQARSMRRIEDLPVKKPRMDPAESPLARLRNRTDKDGEPLISREQMEAGERLRHDLYRAGMTPKVTQSWDGIPKTRQRRSAPGAGIDMSDYINAARERVVRALTAVGPEYIDLLIDLCAHLKGLEEIEKTASLPPRSARKFLQHALTALARHYGMLPPPNIETLVSGRLRHWGGTGYHLPGQPADDRG